MAAAIHPLIPLTPSEISAAAAIVRKELQENQSDPSTTIRFKHITLLEPPKAQLLPYLDAESAGSPVSERPVVPRCAQVSYSSLGGAFTEAVVNLDTEYIVQKVVTRQDQYSPLDRDEVIRCNEVILTHPDVREAVGKLGLAEDTVIQCDTWPYGSDKFSTKQTPKLLQAMLYARAPNNHPDSNQYSFPLPFSPVFDPATEKIIRMDLLPTGGTEDGSKTGTAPEKPLAHCVENEYHPDLLAGEFRTDLKPLIVQQPEGPSFQVQDSNLITWQKWRFRLGFNWREGMTIHDVRYDGRKMFYRLSMSEMTVPYGDPRAPYHRRQAFDLGDAGAGTTANNLRLGCDCLGAIQYFDGWLNDSRGQPFHAPNVVCLHEQDSGIGWKHTNSRTDVAVVTRARILVVQSIITVGNYEYVFAWHFTQSGQIDFETRATGILATSLIDPGKQSHWGKVVSPGVLAANHQHLFCLRIDAMIDGTKNTVLHEESIPLPASEDENPHGNAWKVVKTHVEKSGAFDAAPEKNRIFKIVNEEKINPVSGAPVGFKFVPVPSQLLMADRSSIVRKRAKFAEHHIWVTRYRDGDLWAGGKWTNQSLVEEDGVADYAARDETVRDEDLVVWLTYGLTHNPRVEDYPVMPAEVMTVSLKPADFFTRNPALDVPVSTQAFNQSCLIEEQKPLCCPDATKQKL